MGTPPPAVIRVVLDTNTVVSALLFAGTASRLVPVWQSRRISLLVSKAIVEEYLRVLAYPKFELTSEEVRRLLDEEMLPFIETVRVRRRLRPPVADQDDHTFLECAVLGRARYLVTGDRELTELGHDRGVTILSVGEFLALLER